MPDAPLRTRAGAGTFLTDAFIAAGKTFTLLQFAKGQAADVPGAVQAIQIGADTDLIDATGAAETRYDAQPGTTYLLRPDGYVAARFRHLTRAAVEAALARASATG
jgi:3-(3-hydroxy-phenyl)propionate hydroxylase